MKLLLVITVLASSLSPAAAQSTLTFQQGVAGYAGTQDTGVRSTIPATNAGQWQYIGWDDNFLQEDFTFQNGSAGYNGTSDTVISQAAATTNAGAWTYWGWDDDALGSVYPAYSLIKFESVFGPGAGQILAGSQISSAILQYTCFNSGGPASVHAMNSTWVESTTWNSFTFNYEFIATSTASGGTQGTCDLTQSLQSISDGAPNYGWVFIPVTDSGVEAHSSEATTGPKPSLLVTTSEEDIAYSLIRFDDLIGDANGQIPPGSSVQSAALVYDVYNSGGLSEVHEMNTPWNESETWNSFQARVYSQQVLSTASGMMGQQSCDVTSSIQSYLNGAPNRGWVFLPNNNDGVEIHSSEASSPGQRPKLVVNFTAPDPCGDGVSNYCVSSPNSVSLTGAQISLLGTPSVSANSMILEAQNLRPNQFGVFFTGPAKQDPPVSFGDGYRCVSLFALARFNPPTPTGSGIAQRGIDMTQPPLDTTDAGDTRYFQFWYRDPGPIGAGYNLTDGLEITFCP